MKILKFSLLTNELLKKAPYLISKQVLLIQLTYDFKTGTSAFAQSTVCNSAAVHHFTWAYSTSCSAPPQTRAMRACRTILSSMIWDGTAARGLATAQFPALILRGFRGAPPRQDFRLLTFYNRETPI